MESSNGEMLVYQIAEYERETFPGTGDNKCSCNSFEMNIYFWRYCNLLLGGYGNYDKMITAMVMKEKLRNILLWWFDILMNISNTEVIVDKFWRCLVTHEVGDDVDGHREDDGAVVLGWDAVEGLEVAQLKH